MTESVSVTAHLSTPVLGVERWPLPLDAPLSWAAWQDRVARGLPVEPITDDHAEDFDLPLARESVAGTWVWCTSRAHLDVVAWTAVQVRRKPATAPMARFAPDAKHHAGLGPFKARDTTMEATLCRSITWHALTPDRAELERLLGLVTNLGGRHRNGFGHVDRWEVAPHPDREAWRDRPMPPEHASRAPYWHPSRRRG